MRPLRKLFGRKDGVGAQQEMSFSAEKQTQFLGGKVILPYL